MTLQSSGAISLSNVNVELGRSSTATICMNCSGVRTLFGVSSGSISMSSGYGKSNIPVGSSTYTAPGAYTFVVPQHTTRLSGLAISGGSAGGRPSHYIYQCFAVPHASFSSMWSGYVYGGSGGPGGGIAYRNNFSVTTGQSYTVYVASCAGGFWTTGSGSYVVSTSGSPSGYPVYSYPSTNSMQFFSGSTYGSTYAVGGRVQGSGSSAQSGVRCQQGNCPWAGGGGGGGGVAGSACAHVTNYCSYYGGFYTTCCFNYGAGGSTYGRACGSFYQFNGSCSSWKNSCSPHGGWPMSGKHGYGRNGGSAGGSAPSDPYARWGCNYCYYAGYKAGVGAGGGGGSNATYGFNNSGSFPSTGGSVQGGYGGGGGSGGAAGGSGSNCGYGSGGSHSGNGGGYGGGGGGASAALSVANFSYGPNWSPSYSYGACSGSDCWWHNRGIYAGVGASGTVRLIYPGCTRSYPSTNVGCP